MLTFAEALAKQEDKVSKDEAHYQEWPHLFVGSGGVQQCAECSMFVGPDGCTAVEGKISPTGWCTLFEADVEKAGPVDHGSPIVPIQGSILPEDILRTDAAKTGIPIVDAAMDGPIIKQNINNPTIDRTYDVPYGSGGSEPLEDPTTYLDRHVPRTMTVGTVTFDPAEPFCIHENVEQKIMAMLMQAGFDSETAYKIGHYLFAEVAEDSWYRNHGMDPAEVEAMEKPWLEDIQDENPENPPPNLYQKPYPHNDVTLARGENFTEAHPTPDKVARAMAVLVPELLGNAAAGSSTLKADTEDSQMTVHADVLKQLRETHPEIAALLEKQSPTAGDVHQATSLGDKKKRRSFKDTLAEAKGKKAPKDDAVGKSETDWNIPLDIVKTEPDQQLVFGWASVSSIDGELVVDKQDDIILEEDLEKAAYDFVLYSRSQGDMHARKGVGRCVESMVFTKQKQELLGIDLGLVGWWCGFKVDSAETWALVKAGKLPEFSIGGKAMRVPT